MLLQIFVIVIYIHKGDTEVRKVTFSELRHDVSKYAAAFKKLGVKKGDRVVGK